METIHLYQCDSSKPVLIRPDIADSDAVINGNWLCKTWVEDRYGAVVIAPRVESTKTDDNKYFVVSLSKTDTSALTVTGSLTEYKWVVELTNDNLTPAYEREIPLTVALKA